VKRLLAALLCTALPAPGVTADRPAGIAAAEAIAKAALGENCDMNGMEEVPISGPGAEGFAHSVYRFSYKPAYDPAARMFRPSSTCSSAAPAPTISAMPSC